MPTATSQELTIGDIARMAGCAIHRIEHLVRARAIEPSRRAGAYRLFADEAAQRLITEIKDADARKAASN